LPTRGIDRNGNVQVGGVHDGEQGMKVPSRVRYADKYFGPHSGPYI
jgi:hypothetical protein